jgi:hypothetical protein
MIKDVHRLSVACDYGVELSMNKARAWTFKTESIENDNVAYFHEAVASRFQAC